MGDEGEREERERDREGAREGETQQWSLLPAPTTYLQHKRRFVLGKSRAAVGEDGGGANGTCGEGQACAQRRARGRARAGERGPAGLLLRTRKKWRKADGSAAARTLGSTTKQHGAVERGS